MRVVIFCHSLISDWNHGNAHFLRGLACELIGRGHCLAIYEPEDAWSVKNLVHDHGQKALEGFHAAYPELKSHRYRAGQLDLDRALEGADLVIVHEWNEPSLVRDIGVHHSGESNYVLFFHDTHHRSQTAPAEMQQFSLSDYDAVLAFGEVVSDTYVARGWCKRAFTLHEAADVRRFRPLERATRGGDLVWIGNFGDEERTSELEEFLIEPVRNLRLRARVYGVRYSSSTLKKLAAVGIEYGGYLPNWEVPRVFSEHRVTIHVPRRPYVERLKGIPTIRPFEAMACGIPLVSAPWRDSEGLFGTGRDYLVVEDGKEMQKALRFVLEHPEFAKGMAVRARATIVEKHTCAHRVDALLNHYRTVRAERRSVAVGQEDVRDVNVGARVAWA
ncbi:MAG: glycosyltransferase [Polyangiaceae bacterium]